MRPVNRRRFLRGLLGGSAVCVGLPALEIFAGRRAWGATCDDGFPARFGVFMWGNGNLPQRWNPEATGDEWELSDQLSPLGDLKQHVSVVSGFSIKVDNISPHWSAACALLTGVPILGDDDSWTVAAPTLDQVIAAQIGGDTLYRSIQVGVTTEECFSYAGPNTQNYGVVDPYTLYERLFGDTFREPGEGGQVDPSLAYRRSALDAVMDDLAALDAELGANDRQRLEQHLDGVRDLELRLARLAEDPPELEACVRPPPPEQSYPDVDGRPQISLRSQVMAELVAMSLACDQTRVFFMQLDAPLDNTLFPDATDGHHNLTHDEPDDQPQVNAITKACVAEYANLLDALRAVPEGEGTLLDNCVVLGMSEHSEGRTHSLDDIPLLIGGGGCGRLVTGRHVRSYSQENINKPMLSVLRAMGVALPSWGEGDT
ncbi:MAG: DUF1552 domain-containing protein, partial [Alphaproteobacteria bacterium]|nr:DUF1552 domain-containing protein [Alphaproteobacteria bacterium]